MNIVADARVCRRPVDVGSVRGSAALERLVGDLSIVDVLDVGAGHGAQADRARAAGCRVFTIDLAPPADHVGDFMSWMGGKAGFDAVWACHVLEHQPNPNAFLVGCRERLRPGGKLFVTVPPLKHEIVGGHVTLWNAGLLLYQMVLAGFDCRNARVGTYASGPGYPVYNISVIAERPRSAIALPQLRMDDGDIDTLAPFFPIDVHQGFDGRLTDINW